MKKILVTGGSGFIGLNFISAYKKKYDIVSHVPEETDLTRYDDVKKLFESARFDAVIHIAGMRDIMSDAALYADDLLAFKNVQYASVLNGVKKLLVVGDASDLDTSRSLENANENVFGESVPVAGYGLGRYLIHKLASKDKISTVLRFFDVYGAGASVEEGHPLEILSHAIVGKKQIEVPANKTFSTIYIDDACKIVSLFIDNDYEKGIYNVASPVPIKLGDFAKKAKSYAKKDGRELSVSVGEENGIFTADVSKLLDALGSFKFTAHSTGITKTLDYCKSHKSLLKPKEVK